MWNWLYTQFETCFGVAVTPAFVFAVLDVLCNLALKIAFLGKSNMRVGGGKLYG